MSAVVPAHGNTDAGLVRDELRRILASKLFSDSPRASRFLSYIVEEVLAGRGQNLKEYSIGVEVFERGEAFDARVDTIVRVEASRLRNRLRQYYENHGRADTVRIELPRGGYAPVFTITPKPKAPRRKLLIAASILTAAVTGIWFLPSLISRFRAPTLPLERSVAVLPFQNVGGNPDNQALCDGVIETVTSRLTEQEQFHGSFWVVDAADVRESGVHSPQQAFRTFGVNLAVTGSVQRPGETMRVTVNLNDARTGRHLDARTIHLRRAEFYGIEDEVEAAVIDMLKLQLPRIHGRAVAKTKEPSAEDFYLQGRGYLQRGPESAESAASLFQQALQKDPKYVLAYAGLAEAYLQRYESTKEQTWIDKAETDAQEARKLDPELPAVHITIGLIHRGRGRYEEAIRELSEALARDPRNADAHNYLALAYEAAGHLPEAEQVFKDAIDLRPDYWKVYDSLGKFYLRRGRNGEAEKMFQRAIDLAPDNARALANLGGVYIRTRQLQNAEEQLRRSLAIHPTYGAYNNLGSLYFEQQRYAESVPMFENAVRLGGANSALLNGLAEAYQRSPGMEQKAHETFDKARVSAERELAVNPNDSDARSRLAWIYAETGQSKRAIAEANQALKQAPSNVDVLTKCMLAYELSGQRNRALEVFATARRNGYSIEEVRNWPEFAAFRQDPRYKALKENTNNEKK